ncbi:MAG: hypothetical protein QOH96_1683 [Blastocatellia bacterium]|jgi:hypothetical protein|nr:hypothetical protein [Blastocatellia bacterium]
MVRIYRHGHWSVPQGINCFVTRTQELCRASFGCPFDVCTQTPPRRVPKTIVEFIRLHISSFAPPFKDANHLDTKF